MVSRRTLLRAAGLPVVAPLTACAKTGTDGGTADDAAALRLKWWGGDARTKAYRSALEAYREVRPAVTVTTLPSGYDGYFAQLDSDIASDTAADVIQMDTALVGEYARLGALLPLDGRLALAGFPEALLAAGTVDGKLYGVPSGTGAVLVTYDKTVLSGAGADPPAADWTWDGLRTYAEKLTKTLDGVYGVSDGGGDDVGAFQIFLRQRGKDLYTADGKLGYLSADLEEWFSFWDAMRKSRAAAPGAVTSEASNDPARNPLITGRVAITFGSGLEISLPPLTSHDLDFVPVPNGPPGSAEGHWLNGGVLLSAYARSKAADQAVNLIGFFAENEKAITAMGLTRGIPPTEKARAAVAGLLNPAQQRAVTATDLVAKRVATAGSAAPPIAPKGAGQVKELLFKNNLAVAFGEKTVVGAVDSVLAGAASVLA